MHIYHSSSNIMMWIEYGKIHFTWWDNKNMGNKRRWISRKCDVRCWGLMSVFTGIIVLAHVNVVWLRGKTPSNKLVLGVLRSLSSHGGRRISRPKPLNTLHVTLNLLHVVCFPTQSTPPHAASALEEENLTLAWGHDP